MRSDSIAVRLPHYGNEPEYFRELVIAPILYLLNAF